MQQHQAISRLLLSQAVDVTRAEEGQHCVTISCVLFPAPGSMAMEASSDGEEDAESTDKVTETVMNGGMKETLSLTVDAKTETAVFKR